GGPDAYRKPGTPPPCHPRRAWPQSGNGQGPGRSLVHVRTSLTTESTTQPRALRVSPLDRESTKTCSGDRRRSRCCAITDWIEVQKHAVTTTLLRHPQ